MPATISTKQKSVAAAFLKRSASLIGGAAGSYINEVAPVSGSIIKEASSELMRIENKLQTRRKSSINLRQFKGSITMRGVYNWFMGQETSFSGEPAYEDTLDFDNGVQGSSEQASIAERQMTESAKQTNQLAGAILGSAKQQVESSAYLMSEIKSTVEAQTSVITQGFDRTNETLEKILEVLTKNTSTLIETTAAGFDSMSESEKMLGGGKFTLSSYKKLVKENIQNSPLGMVMPFLSMMNVPGMSAKDMMKEILSPESLTKMMFGGVVNKAAPNLKKNMQALDEAVNNVIMGSLIRLGQNKSWGIGGMISRMFGINSDRKEFGNAGKDRFELKATPFDTQTKEAIVQVIPGYLKEILHALNGKNQIYDYRSRSFTTQDKINKNFRNTGVTRNSLYYANASVMDAFGSGQFESVVYDILMTDIGSASGENRRYILSTIANGGFAEYMKDRLTGLGVDLKQKERAALNKIGRQLAKNGMNTVNIGNQAALNNVNRNQRLSQLENEYKSLGMNISTRTSSQDEIKTLLEESGLVQPKISSNGAHLTGIAYSNSALYNIFQILNRGINVHQVDHKFEDWSKNLEPPSDGPRSARIKGVNRVQTDTDSIGRYQQEVNTETSKTAGGLGKALVSGTAKDVTKAFEDMIHGIGGNITGSIQHKLFGTSYEYQDEKGNIVRVKQNDKGGVLGFVETSVKESMKNTGAKTSKWFSSVSSYFDYSSDPNTPKSIQNKRKQIIGASVGAMAGLGVLGGPLGLLMGSIAGSALVSTEGLGSKIHEMLLGKGDAKGKHKGLITTVVDKVVNPIEFQIGKTFHHFGNILRKNILGPLSDIGYAIKERVTNAAGGIFGKVFRGIGKLLLAPFKGAAALAKFPIKLIGGLVRGASSAATGVFGAVAEGAAGLIGGRKSIKGIRARRKARNAEIEADDANSLYNDEDLWTENKQARRAEFGAKLGEATSEDKEIISANNTTAENTGVMKNQLGQIIGLLGGVDSSSSVKPASSIHGGTQSKRDADVQARNAAQDKASSYESSDDDQFANNALVAASVIASEGDITATDQRHVNKIMREASKPHSDDQAVGASMTALMDSQSEAKAEEKEDTTSRWSKLWDLLKGIGAAILGIGTLGALASFLQDLFGDKEDKGGDNPGNAGDTGEEGTKIPNSNDPGNQGMNTVGALFDVKADSRWDWVTPGTNLYHTDTDAGNNLIANPTATHGKNMMLGGAQIIQGIMQPAWHTFKAASAAEKLYAASGNYQTAVRDAASGMLPGPGTENVQPWELSADTQKYYNQGQKYAKQGDKYSDKLNADEAKYGKEIDAEGNVHYGTHQGSNLAKELGKNVARMGLASLGGKAVGKIVEKGAQNLGFTEEQAEKAGNIGEAIGTAGSMAQQALSPLTGRESWMDKVLGWFKKAFDFLSDHLGKSKRLSKWASKISSFFDDIYNKTVGKLTDKIANKIAQKVGNEAGASTAKQVAGGVAGAGIAFGAISGGIHGLTSAANLFMVSDDDVDWWMRLVSTIVNGAWSALEWTPGFGYVMAAIDVADAILFQGIFHKSLKSYVADFIYELFRGELGDENGKLQTAQANFKDELDEYNEKHGTSLNISAYNDLKNNTGLIDMIWRGKYEEDEAGGRKPGGLSGMLHGENIYMRDEEGNIMRDSEGAGIQLVDQYGNTKKMETKLGDKASNLWSQIKLGLFGGDIYETDQFGNALYDPNTGGYKVKEHQKNVVSAFIDRLRNNQSSMQKAAEEGDLDTIASISNESISQTPENPAAAYTSEVDYINQMTNYPIAAMQWSGDQMYDATADQASAAQSNVSIWQTAMSNAQQLAQKGDISKLWALNPTFNTNDPMAGMWMTTFNMNRSMLSMNPMMMTVSNNASEMTWEAPSTQTNSTSYNPYVRMGYGSPDNSETADIEQSTTNDATTSSSSDRAYNPEASPFGENVGFKLTSGYGTRKWPKTEFHTGLDIVPSDYSSKYKSTQQAAIYNKTAGGVVTKVVKYVSDSDTASTVQRQGYGRVAASSPDIMGDVVYTGNNPSGNEVWIDNPEGTIRTKYMHLKAGSIPSSIKVGAKLGNGQQIGKMGSTGFSTAPHLHYQKERLLVSGDMEGWIPYDPTDEMFLSAEEIDEITGTDAPPSPSDHLTETAGKGSEAGILAQLAQHIGNVAKGFMSLITGGLIDIVSSATGGNNEFLDAVSNGASSSCEAFLEMCRKEIGTTETGDNNVKYNNNNGLPWCMYFVQWCFKQAGMPLAIDSASCSAVLNYYKTSEPDKWIPPGNSPQPGDIFFEYPETAESSHTGIVESVSGSTMKTIEGNSGNQVRENERQISYAQGGFVRPVDWSSIDNMSSAAISSTNSGKLTGEGVQALWNYLKGFGYDDNTVAGILGNLQHESNLDSNMLEHGLSESGRSKWKQYIGDDITAGYETNRSGVDSFFQNVLTPANNNQYGAGKWHPNAYKADDGHYYPGIGFVQWTGPRAKKLLEFAKAKGKHWYDADLQMDYFQSEVPNYPSFLGGSSPEESANLVRQNYVGVGDSNAGSQRRNYAKEIYNTYAGKNSNSANPYERMGVGGPDTTGTRHVLPAGGPGDGSTNSAISSSRSYTPKPTSTPLRSRVSNVRVGTTLGSTATRLNTSINPGLTTSSTSASKGTDLSEVVQAMSLILDTLERIYSSEETGNSLLGSINDKDFQDTGLRNELNAMKNAVPKTRSRSGRPIQTSQSTARSVTAMARG